MNMWKRARDGMTSELFGAILCACSAFNALQIHPYVSIMFGWVAGVLFFYWKADLPLLFAHHRQLHYQIHELSLLVEHERRVSNELQAELDRLKEAVDGIIAKREAKEKTER